MNERDFFKDPFTRPEIEELLEGRSASDMFNFKSPSFKKIGLDREKMGDEQLIDLMLKEPRLVRRPVVRIGSQVYFGANRKFLEKMIA
jgi:arsenate reductase/regulatory protein spx